MSDVMVLNLTEVLTGLILIRGGTHQKIYTKVRSLPHELRIRGNAGPTRSVSHVNIVYRLSCGPAPRTATAVTGTRRQSHRTSRFTKSLQTKALRPRENYESRKKHMQKD